MIAKYGRQGFSLIEVLVAMACSSIMIAALYQMFYSQQKSYLQQDEIAGMQQNLRAGFYLMTKDIRSAGFDPLNTANAGLVTDFAAPHEIFDPDINYAVDTNVIAFTIDDNEDGSIQATDREQIAYRLKDDNLQIYSTSRATWESIADNVDALNFVYLDSGGIVTGTPNAIRSVEVTMLVKSEEKQAKELHQHRQRRLSTTIRIRNL
jgi:prepilin-type N-terminal cleavage/methylation domain-containing protein